MRIKRDWWKSLIFSLIVTNLIHLVAYLLVESLGYTQMKFWHGLLITNVIALLLWLFRAVEWES